MLSLIKLKNIFPSFLSGILNSYTQVFFSNNRIFAVILIIVTFFNVFAGLSGLLMIIFSNVLAYLIGLNRSHIKSGFYGFNSLLVGLGLGIFYQPGLEYFILLIFVAFLTLFLTVMVEGVIGKYGLPFLSFSFLISVWLVTMASRQFTSLEVSEQGIYSLNEMYSLGGLSMVKIYEWFERLAWPDMIKLYFKSLGAILFQYHLVPGILLAVGLLIYSRISFTLSLLGFFSAYFYYTFIGANFNELNYGYIGFNFILTAIAIGGFFIIPSKYSYLWVILLTPLISIFLTSTNAVFALFQLSVFSLPFNLVVVLYLYVLKFRERFYSKPQMVLYQQYSPEKNLYSNLNYNQRFGKAAYLKLSLPFMGIWKVTQGHEGDLTHQGEWKHAWDFEITDEKDSPFSGKGLLREDYYCYGKPVTAPAAGWVETYVDDVEDNEISEINVSQNWGNSIVLRHSDFLYTKLSHLKKGSIKVKIGDYVKKGDLIAACGNSGRSPAPHLHFQIQSTPFIGSKTMNYPIGQFIVHTAASYSLKTFDIPETGTRVSGIEKDDIMMKSFQLIPGQKLCFGVKDPSGSESEVKWEVVADMGNQTYVSCEISGSKAFYQFDNETLQFTHFEGNRKSLLYYFYLGAYRVSTCFYPGLKLKDIYPVSVMKQRILMIFQDFLAPFVVFMKPIYTIEYLTSEDHFTHSKAWLKAKTIMLIGRKEIRKIDYEFEAGRSGLERIVITENENRTELTRREE